MDQLKELNNSLSKLVNGDISLVSELGAVQLATQAAISQAFKTPEVIRLFGRREPKQLRDRLQSLDQEVKLNRLTSDARDRQKVSVSFQIHFTLTIFSLPGGNTNRSPPTERTTFHYGTAIPRKAQRHRERLQKRRIRTSHRGRLNKRAQYNFYLLTSSHISYVQLRIIKKPFYKTNVYVNIHVYTILL